MKEYNLKINGKDYRVAVAGISDGKACVSVNGVDYTVDLPEECGIVDSAPAASEGLATPVATAKAAAVKPAGGTKAVEAPLPGVILNLYVTQGQNVKRGDRIAVLEAMKMENEILAPKDGTIKEVFVQRGDSVLEGAKIAVIA